MGELRDQGVYTGELEAQANYKRFGQQRGRGRGKREENCEYQKKKFHTTSWDSRRLYRKIHGQGSIVYGNANGPEVVLRKVGELYDQRFQSLYKQAKRSKGFCEQNEG